MFDDIVIGCGFAGAVAARELAEKAGHKVLVIDRRPHVGGNCYDEIDSNGVLIHVYGPHIFHTGNKAVFDYLSQFTEWNGFVHEVVADVNGTYIPVPFNLNTLRIAFPDKAEALEQKLVAEYGMDTKVPILKLKANPDKDIQEIADYVYKNIFLCYTMKQWGKTPEEIDESVTGRVPVYISYDNRYFQDAYQGLPLEGYTRLFENMLDHPGITLRLDTDVKDILKFTENEIFFEDKLFSGNVIFTGQVDELFEYEYGMLPYRTLRFETEYYEADSVLPKAVVNYTVSEDYTRISEYKKMTGQKCKGSTIMKEYSSAYTGKSGETPYYAIINDDNMNIYNSYVRKAEQYNNLHLLGRLAEYRYYNIDAIVENAIKLSVGLMK